MENSFVIDRLPEALTLTAEEWIDLLCEETVADSAGVQDVVLLNAIPDVLSTPAVLVELMLENETDIVMAALADWLPARLAACNRGPSAVVDMLETPRIRALSILPQAQHQVKEAARWIQMPYTLDVPSLCSKTHEALKLHVGMDSSHEHGTGSRLWLGGMILAEWLWHRYCLDSDSPVTGKRVLELGAGFCGLPAIIAAKSGASHVIASDGVLEVWQQLVRNVASLGVEARHLRWGIDSPSSGEPAEVVLFADCMYSREGVQLLLLCLGDCLSACPYLVVHGTLEPKARSGSREFLDAMVEFGFVAQRELWSEEILAAILKKYPKRSEDDDEQELRKVELWTWFSQPMASLHIPDYSTESRP